MDSTPGGSWITAIQPTLHYTVNEGKMVFGSQLVENSLVVHFDQAEGHYSLTQVGIDFISQCSVSFRLRINMMKLCTSLNFMETT